MSIQPLDIFDLRKAMLDELATRRKGPFNYADERDGKEALYGNTGAVTLMAGVAALPGDRSHREGLARRILEIYIPGQPAGSACHASHMVISALNLLGWPPPAHSEVLAPVSPEELVDWLDQHDWSTTHKELCGAVIPLLASGRVSREWIDTFRRQIDARLDPDRPLETFCKADAEPWRVVSTMYHILCAFDAGRIPYPKPDMLIKRLLDLRWEEATSDTPQTACTDGDWAYMLLRLCEHEPHHFEQAIAAIRKVSARRLEYWRQHRETILAYTTHHLYCYLWVTGVFQSCVRDHYAGPYIHDTLNDPALMQLAC